MKGLIFLLLVFFICLHSCRVRNGDGEYEIPSTIDLLKANKWVLKERYHITYKDGKPIVQGGSHMDRCLREETYFSVGDSVGWSLTWNTQYEWKKRDYCVSNRDTVIGTLGIDTSQDNKVLINFSNLLGPFEIRALNDSVFEIANRGKGSGDSTIYYQHYRAL